MARHGMARHENDTTRYTANLFQFQNAQESKTYIKQIQIGYEIQQINTI